LKKAVIAQHGPYPRVRFLDEDSKMFKPEKTIQMLVPKMFHTLREGRMQGYDIYWEGEKRWVKADVAIGHKSDFKAYTINEWIFLFLSHRDGGEQRFFHTYWDHQGTLWVRTSTVSERKGTPVAFSMPSEQPGTWV